MKKFEAKTQRGDVDVRYVVLALDEEMAKERIFQISGERLAVKAL